MQNSFTTVISGTMDSLVLEPQANLNLNLGAWYIEVHSIMVELVGRANVDEICVLSCNATTGMLSKNSLTEIVETPLVQCHIYKPRANMAHICPIYFPAGKKYPLNTRISKLRFNLTPRQARLPNDAIISLHFTLERFSA